MAETETWEIARPSSGLPGLPVCENLRYLGNDRCGKLAKHDKPILDTLARSIIREHELSCIAKMNFSRFCSLIRLDLDVNRSVGDFIALQLPVLSL